VSRAGHTYNVKANYPKTVKCPNVGHHPHGVLRAPTCASRFTATKDFSTTERLELVQESS
jgi:hypothetical protein